MFHDRQHGMSLIAAIFIVVILAILAVVLTVYTITASEESGNEYLSTQALYYAETGIYNALTDITYDHTLDVTSYTFSNPVGAATITAAKVGTTWTLECTATCGDPTSQKYGRRTVRVLFEE